MAVADVPHIGEGNSTMAFHPPNLRITCAVAMAATIFLASCGSQDAATVGGSQGAATQDAKGQKKSDEPSATKDPMKEGY
jgi:hypothetical protein